MADPETRDAPPATTEAETEKTEQIIDGGRQPPTRPGWKAGVAVLAFLGGFVAYITYI